MVSWEVVGLVFEEGEGDFEEFVEDGEEDGHLGFAGGGEAVGEGFEAGVVRAAPTRAARRVARSFGK